MIDFKQLTAGRVKITNNRKQKVYIPAVIYRGNLIRLHRICKTATQAEEYAARLIAKGIRMKK